MSTESDGTHYYGDGCPEHSVCQPLLAMPCKDCDGCMSLDEPPATERARYRTREEINASGYEAICIPGPESLLPHDCRGHDHLPGARAPMPADPR